MKGGHGLDSISFFNGGRGFWERGDDLFQRFAVVTLKINLMTKNIFNDKNGL